MAVEFGECADDRPERLGVSSWTGNFDGQCDLRHGFGEHVGYGEHGDAGIAGDYTGKFFDAEQRDEAICGDGHIQRRLDAGHYAVGVVELFDAGSGDDYESGTGVEPDDGKHDDYGDAGSGYEFDDAYGIEREAVIDHDYTDQSARDQGNVSEVHGDGQLQRRKHGDVDECFVAVVQ